MESLKLSVRATPRTPITPRTPKSSKKHNKHDVDNIPSQRFKVGYQKVTLDIDLEQNQIIGETEITILPQDSHLKQVKLDCHGIQIKSIIVNQRRAQYSYDDFLQNQEYMNDSENPVLSDYNYDPYFDSNSNNISIQQHEMLRTKFFPLFSDQNNPTDPSSSFSTCTSELTITVPESIKLRLQNSSKILFSPANTNRSFNETPNTANTLFNSDKVYTPLNIKINYIVKNSKNGIQFYGGKHTNIPKHLWYCYTLNNDIGCSASSWVPCIDNFYEKPAWDINIVVPKTVSDIGTSKIIGSKEAEKALRKIAMQQMSMDETKVPHKSTNDQKFDIGNHEEVAEDDDDDEEEEEGEEEGEDNEDKIENTPLVVVVPELVSSRESPHPIDVAKKLVNFQFFNPVCPHHLGFAVGCFDKIPIVDVKPGTDDLTLNYQSVTGDVTKDVLLELNGDVVNTNKVPTLLYFHPGRKQEVINSTLFLYKALEFYSKEFSSFPFTSYTLLFVDGLSSDTCSFAGMTIACSNLLYGPTLIEPIFDTTEKLSIALAEQYSGVNVLPKTLNDIWLTIGISRYMSYQFLKKLFGRNHYKFLFQKRCELLCDLDIGKRPLSNQLFRFPINSDQDLDLIRLKAPLVLTILDRRITKTDKLFGLLRVIPKIFLQAMSNDLINGNNLSTAHFQRVCEKVAHHKLEAFFQNWVHSSGVPTFRVTQKFNKKRLIIEMTIRQMQSSSLNSIEDNIANKEKVDEKKTKNFVDDANTFLIEQDKFTTQPTFSGPVTVRIHETDGSPYEHILAISDALTKLDIQYNTKYRRKKRERREGTEEVDDNEKDNKDTKKKDKDKNEEPKISMLGDVLVSLEELKNWDLKDEDSLALNDEENSEIQATTTTADDDKDEAFEWLRFDADNEWICKYTINLTDEKFESQLKQDRDVKAHYESIKHFKNLTRPTLSHAKILLRTLLDSRYYYGIRVEAAKALAKISSEDNDHIGLRCLLKTFKYLYCYDNKIVKGYNEFDPKEYIPKPADFSNFTDLFVSQAILESLSKVKNKNGDSPIELKRIMLNLLKFHDNSINKFDDSLFYCSLIKSLCRLVIVSNREIPDIHMTTQTTPQPKDSKDEFIFSSICELNRCLKMDEWSPSYQHRITKTVIEQKIELVRSGLARLTFMDLIQYTVPDYNDSIRLTAFNGLLLLGGFRNANILNYYFTTMKLDESPFIKYQLNKSLVKCIGVAANSGIPTILDDEEFLQNVDFKDDQSKTLGNRLIQIEDTKSAKMSIQSRKDELARTSIKGSIDLLRRHLGIGKGLSHELWNTVHSCLVPINTRRNIFDIMMILYEPKDSFIISTKLPSDKKIVFAVKSKVFEPDNIAKSSFVVSFKREARFKIQLPAIKFKVADDKPKKIKKVENEINNPPDTTTSPCKKSKKHKISEFVSYEKSLIKFEIKIKLPIKKDKLLQPENTNEHEISSSASIQNPQSAETSISNGILSPKITIANDNKEIVIARNVIRHDNLSPPRFVRINLITKELKVSTNEEFTKYYIPKHFVTLKIHKNKLKELEEKSSGIITDDKKDNNIYTHTSERVDKNVKPGTTVKLELKKEKVEVKEKKEASLNNDKLKKYTEISSNKKKNKHAKDIRSKDLNGHPMSQSPNSIPSTSSTSSVMSLKWDKNDIVGKLNPMKRSADSPSPSSLKLSLGRARSRSDSPENNDEPPKKRVSGPKIKLRLK